MSERNEEGRGKPLAIHQFCSASNADFRARRKNAIRDGTPSPPPPAMTVTVSPSRLFHVRDGTELSPRERVLLLRLERDFTPDLVRTVLKPLVSGASPVSLRVLDWAVTNWSKRHNVICTALSDSGEVTNVSCTSAAPRLRASRSIASVAQTVWAQHVRVGRRARPAIPADRCSTASAAGDTRRPRIGSNAGGHAPARGRGRRDDGIHQRHGV